MFFFHPVFFPCIFFQGGRVRLKLFKFGVGVPDLINIIISALFQFLQLTVMPKLRQQIAVIEK